MNLSVLLAASTLALAVSPCAAQVTTSQYNNSRTAATLHEKILTPQNVNAQKFGKLGAFKVDGAVYAQPLYVPAVPIPGKGTHDILYVATEHDSVYAFDANRASDPPLWKVSFLDKSRGVTTLSEDIVACPFIRPEVGITSTPVIDLSLVGVISHPYLRRFWAKLPRSQLRLGPTEQRDFSYRSIPGF